MLEVETLMEDLPRDFFIKIEQNPHLLGRLSLFRTGSKFSLDVDLVYADSKKIYHHIKAIHAQADSQEILELGVHAIAEFLSASKQ